MGEEQRRTLTQEVTHETMIEQLCQILGCSGACLLLHCSDSKLRHPLLDIWSTHLPIVMLGVLAEAGWDNLSCESVEALCDLAIQSGQMLTLHARLPSSVCQDIQSLAAIPLERPAGLLGILLLADKRPQQFGEGEERLLHTYLPIYTSQLEVSLLTQAQLFVKESREHSNVGEEAKLGQSSRSDFVAMVGHELRAPLSIIKGYAGLMQIYGDISDPHDSEITPERRQHYLAEIMEQTNMLELLINDLLDISRLQRDKLTLQISAVDIGALCQQVIRLEQIRAEQLAAGKYHLICKLAEQLPPVLANVDRLRQVLFNVLENAIKYSPDGGVIEVEASLSGEQEHTVCLTIRDSGIGIPSLQSERLFQPFERLERPEITRIPGNGLGLYIAGKFIEAMAGKIEIQSRQNCGTTIVITLPVLQNCDSSCVKENSLL